MRTALRLADGLTRDFLRHHGVCPLDIDEAGVLVVGVTTEGAVDVLGDIEFAFRRRVRPQPLDDEALDRALERFAAEHDRDGSDVVERGDVAGDLRDLASQPPVVRYVNVLLRDAHDAGASDVHLDATREGLSVRFRIDGALVGVPGPGRAIQTAVISRLKLLADLDIAERRRPQDGRLHLQLEDRELDVRLATVPNLEGESVVLRLLERSQRPVLLGELGLDATSEATLRALATRAHGMLLSTGPTGSGKTTTLYAALQLRTGGRDKIITVEDPIEYHLAGVTQVPVHRQFGVTFDGALRAVLRQDPDVVMIGEMRDEETARTAVQAALTGHAVFSTLHTNDAVSAIPRLLDLGVPAYLVVATLEGVVAQRLVRRVCDGCATADDTPTALAKALGLPSDPPTKIRTRRGHGCPACRGTGYRGRVGLFELLVMTPTIKEAVLAGVSTADLAARARAEGMRTLADAGYDAVRAGLTTAEEVLRVLNA